MKGRARSDALAAGTQPGQHDIDAVLVDRTQRRVGEPQAHPAILALDPEPAPLQVRHEATLRLVVRVGNVVSHHRGFPGDLADSSHRSLLNNRCWAGAPAGEHPGTAERPLIISRKRGGNQPEAFPGTPGLTEERPASPDWDDS